MVINLTSVLRLVDFSKHMGVFDHVIVESNDEVIEYVITYNLCTIVTLLE